MSRSHALIGCLVAIGAIAPSAAAQDLAVTAGNNAKVVFENDKVRGDNLVVAITGGMAVQTLADRSTKPLDTKPGEMRWSDPVTHDTKNTGKAKSRTLVIELKDANK